MGRLLWLLVAVFLYSAAAAIANVAAGLYVLDLSGSRFYLVLSVLLFNAGFAFSSLVVVHVASRRLSGHFVLAAGLVGVAAAVAGMAFARCVVVVAVLNLVYGVFAALIQPVAVSAASRVGGDVAVPRVNMASSLGIVAGDGVAALFAGSIGVQGLLIVAGFLAAAAVLPVLYGPRVQAGVRGYPSPSAPLVTGRARYTPPHVARSSLPMPACRGGVPWQVYAGTLVLFSGVALFFSPMPAYLREAGISDSGIYLLSMEALLASTVAYELLRRLELGVAVAARLLVAASASRVAVFMLPLAGFGGFAPVGAVMALVYLLVGVTWAAISTGLPLLALRLGGGEAGVGRVNAFMSFGLVVGSLVAAPLAEAYGAVATCAAASALAGLSTVFFAVASGRLAGCGNTFKASA
ncbi:hypothetical protein [Hyperthermus butylicus]|uniref:MFS transporter n=1 Tax=Hyperthermus butylicus (strain DSM 5456 / JCM 9403 / PLM1-5) TaxID=415426 RepID=A2BJE6_HYPBU|nr:hypothetical protein [Hyperthermus butylicus]ABM80107.1 hypothetical protein Hbut_0235 [Hyperthermus butylicus DSM 5456]